MGVTHDDRRAPRPKQHAAVLYDESFSSFAQTNETYQSHHSTRAGLGIVPPAQRFVLSHLTRRASLQHETRSGRRFVAGEAFFNYESLGSLRPDLPPIRLFTTHFFGLAVNALFAGFVMTLVKYGYRELLVDYLRAHDESYVSSMDHILEWPGSFALFIGLLSDCRPIAGRRRKPYIVIGWLIAFIVFISIALMDFTAASSWSLLNWRQPSHELAEEAIRPKVERYGGVLLALTLVAVCALQVMFMASLSLTVEFAQREPLQERGKLQATFYALYYLAGAVAQGVTAMFVLTGKSDEPDHIQSKLSLGWAAFILGCSCLLPLPFVAQFLEEPVFNAITVHLSLRRRLIELWRFCHHNVVIRILAFLAVHFFLIGLYNKNARAAVAAWCNMSESKMPTADAADTAGLCLALVFWILFMVNWSWRYVAGIGTVLFVVGYATFTSLVVYDVVREDCFYIIAIAVLDMPRAWIQLYAALLATEIADSGREGVTMGLVQATRIMVGMIAHTTSSGIGKGFPFSVSLDEVAADSSHTRAQVLSGSLVVFAVNLLAVFLVALLPLQKLDAQQLRSFGGYNRYASYGIAVVFVLLFSGTCAINIVALVN